MSRSRARFNQLLNRKVRRFRRELEQWARSEGFIAPNELLVVTAVVKRRRRPKYTVLPLPLFEEDWRTIFKLRWPQKLHETLDSLKKASAGENVAVHEHECTVVNAALRAHDLLYRIKLEKKKVPGVYHLPRFGRMVRIVYP